MVLGVPEDPISGLRPLIGQPHHTVPQSTIEKYRTQVTMVLVVLWWLEYPLYYRS